MSNLVVVVLWFFWSYRMILKKELYLQVPSIIRTSFKFGLNRLQIKSANSMQTRHTVLYSWHNHVYRWFIPLFIGFIGFQPSKVVQDFFRNHPQYHCIRKKYCLEIRIIRYLQFRFSSFLIIFPHETMAAWLWAMAEVCLIHESWAQDRCTGHQDMLRP